MLLHYRDAKVTERHTSFAELAKFDFLVPMAIE